MDVGGGGGGVAPVTFLGEKSWKIQQFVENLQYFVIINTKYTNSKCIQIS